MKTFLLLAVSVSIALAGANRPGGGPGLWSNNRRIRSKSTQPAQTVKPAAPHYNPKPVQTYHPQVQPTGRTYTPIMPKTNMPRTYTKTPADVSVPNKSWPKNNYNQNKNYTSTVQKKDWQNQTNPNATLPNRNWEHNNHQNTTVQRRNWQNQNQYQNRHWNSVTWNEARRRYHGDHHDHSWWRSHYSRFALFWGRLLLYWECWLLIAQPTGMTPPITTTLTTNRFTAPATWRSCAGHRERADRAPTDWAIIATRSTARWGRRRAKRSRTTSATVAWPSLPPSTSLPSRRSDSVNERSSFLEAARRATVVRLFSGAMDCADRRFGQCWCPR